MNRFLLYLILFCCFLSCKNAKEKQPNISQVKLTLEWQRFDQALFQSSWNNFDTAMNQLHAKYGDFLTDYTDNILGIPPFPDSVRRILPQFIHSYQAINDTVQAHFKDLSSEMTILENAFKLVKYYIPKYHLPARIITYVGPLDGYGNVLTSSGLAIGLQMYLGGNCKLYQNDYFQQVYPQYISQKFAPEYMPVNAMKNLTEDIYPTDPSDESLIAKMVYEGKQVYLLHKLLPDLADSLVVGYSQAQLDGCHSNEAMIWNFFVENNMLYSKDGDNIRDYVSEGPSTPVLGVGAPGNIGKFVGWQIVKKFVAENPKITLEQMLHLNNTEIFQKARYKPKS